MAAEQTDRLRKLAIVPAYNEAGMVANVVRDIKRADPSFDVVVVDDGSTDATVREAETNEATVIRLPFNVGIGGAMQTGFKYALNNDYDLAVQVDGDGQHKTEYLDELIAALQTEGRPTWCAEAGSSRTRATRCRSGAGSGTSSSPSC